MLDADHRGPTEEAILHGYGVSKPKRTHRIGEVRIERKTVPTLAAAHHAASRCEKNRRGLPASAVLYLHSRIVLPML